MNKLNRMVIEPYRDEEWNGFVARFVGVPVEVYHEEKTQVVKDLIDAKEEYFATLEKEQKKM